MSYSKVCQVPLKKGELEQVYATSMPFLLTQQQSQSTEGKLNVKPRES